MSEEESEVVLSTERFSVERRSLLRGGRRVVRHVVRHPGSVVIVPCLGDDRVVLIRNHRVSVGRSLWELPAGTREPGEEPSVTAARELREETGYEAASLRPLATFYLAPGISDERMHAFVAQGLSPCAQELDEGELIEVFPTPWIEALAMCADGRIEDAKTLAALLMWARR